MTKYTDSLKKYAKEHNCSYKQAMVANKGKKMNGGGILEDIGKKLGFDMSDNGDGFAEIRTDGSMNEEGERQRKRDNQNKKAKIDLKDNIVKTVVGVAVGGIVEAIAEPEVGPVGAKILGGIAQGATKIALKGTGKGRKQCKKCPTCKQDLDGEGLGLGDAEMPSSVKTLLAQHGDANITSLFAWRPPNKSRGIINLITAGTFEKNVKDLDYRDIFHVGVSFVLSDGYRGSLEKIDSVVATPYMDNLASSDYMITKPRAPNTLNNSMLNILRLFGKQKLWRYDALTSNCQDFVLGFLSVSNALTQPIKTFIEQDASGLLKGAPTKFMQFLTDVERKIKQGITN